MNLAMFLDTEHHTIAQELVALGGSLFGGGMAFRYIRVAAQTMPHPNEGERWYGWFFSFTQKILDNDMYPPPPMVVLSDEGREKKGGDHQ